MTHTSRHPAGTTRRRLILGGAAAAGAAWVAPAVVRVDRASAAPSSCADVTIPWTSVTGTNPWTATGSNGTVTVTVTVTASASGAPDTYLSGGDLITSADGHRVGDTFDFSIVFTDTAGTICRASSRIIDIDQNGRGLGCVDGARFRDEILNLTGAGLTTSAEGGVAEAAPGVWASTLLCKTTDTENLGVTWAVDTGVATGGFRWRMGRPPGSGGGRPDFQLIKLEPFTVCTTSAAAAGGTAASLAGPPVQRRIQD